MMQCDAMYLGYCAHHFEVFKMTLEWHSHALPRSRCTAVSRRFFRMKASMWSTLSSRFQQHREPLSRVLPLVISTNPFSAIHYTSLLPARACTYDVSMAFRSMHTAAVWPCDSRRFSTITIPSTHGKAASFDDPVIARMIP